MSTLGKIAGALGLVLLLTSPLTYALAGTAVYALGKLAAAAALFAFTFASRYLRTRSPGRADPAGAADEPRPMSQATRTGFFYASSTVTVLVAVVAASALNYIVVRRNKTVDLTARKIFSLSPQSVAVLAALKEPVKILAFIPDDDRDRDYVREQLQRYRDRSDKVDFEFLDPTKHPEAAAKHSLRKGQTTLVLTRGTGDSAAQTTVNVVAEQEITNALVKLNAVGEQIVYFLSGHGELPLTPASADGPEASASELRRSLLQEGYAPRPLNLVEAKGAVPGDAALVVLAAPRSPLSAPEVAALESYLDKGGRLMVFVETDAPKGFEALLARYGVQLDQGLVVDPELNPLSPYAILTAFYAEHESVAQLKSLGMILELVTATGLTVLREGLLPGVTAMPVVTSSPAAWVETTPSGAPQLSDGEKVGPITLVAASTRETSAAAGKRFDEARVWVIGDGDLIADAAWGRESNRNLVMNAFAWTSAQVQKITIRPPDRDLSTLDISDESLSNLTLLTLDALPLTLLGLGLVVWIRRRSR